MFSDVESCVQSLDCESCILDSNICLLCVLFLTDKFSCFYYVTPGKKKFESFQLEELKNLFLYGIFFYNLSSPSRKLRGLGI